MTRRLLLVRHASTDATRAAAFGVDEPLDARGRSAAAALRGRLPHAGEVLVSAARRACETAEHAGLVASGLAPGECDFGRWAGRTLRSVAEADEQGVRAWMTDPDAAPHGGESLTALLARVRAWLNEQTRGDGTVIAITHAGVVKAAVVAALDAPPLAFWRVDVAPASVTELHAHDGRWTVTRVNDRGNASGGAVVGDAGVVAADAPSVVRSPL